MCCLVLPFFFFFHIRIQIEKFEGLFKSAIFNHWLGEI